MNPEITLRAGSLLAGIAVAFLLGLFAWRIRLWWKRRNKDVFRDTKGLPDYLRPMQQSQAVKEAEAIKPQPRKVPSRLPDYFWPAPGTSEYTPPSERENA